MLPSKLIFVLTINIIVVTSLDSFSVLPRDIQCCQSYNFLSCERNSACEWDTSQNICDYIEEPLQSDIQSCIDQTIQNSCPSRLNDDLSSIPIFDTRPELVQHTQDSFPSPPQPEILKVNVLKQTCQLS